MVATPENPIPHVLDKDCDARTAAPGRKPWQTPRFIVSEVGDNTNFDIQHPTNDSPSSQIS